MYNCIIVRTIFLRTCVHVHCTFITHVLHAIRNIDLYIIVQLHERFTYNYVYYTCTISVCPDSIQTEI